MAAAIATGQKSFGSSVLNMLTDSFLSSFFWYSNVIEMYSACSRCGSECSIGVLLEKNRMFRTRRIFVRLDSSDAEVLVYSQDLIAKKNARIASWAIARDRGVLAFLWSVLSTLIGMAFCCFVPGSRFRYPLCNCCRRNAVWPSLSNLGSLRPVSRKVCEILLMESATVDAARSLVAFFENVLSLIACPKAARMMWIWDLENPSRYSLLLMPMVGKNFFQFFQVRIRLAFVSSTVAAAAAVVAARRRQIVR